MRKHATARGVWGHGPLEIFGNLEAMRLLLRPFLGQYDASRRPDSRACFTCMTFLPNASYSTGFGFPIVRLPHPLQMRLTRLIVRLEEGKVVGRLRRVLSHCSQPSRKFQHVTTEQWR